MILAATAAGFATMFQGSRWAYPCGGLWTKSGEKSPVATGANWKRKEANMAMSGKRSKSIHSVSGSRAAPENMSLDDRWFRAVADYTYDWESWHSPDGRLIWVNPAVERITGYSVAECLTMRDYPLPLTSGPLVRTSSFGVFIEMATFAGWHSLGSQCTPIRARIWGCGRARVM
jgi:PAS domain-containing protein